MTYRPATMMDDAALEERVAELTAAYRTTAGLAELEALAEVLHRFAPASLAALERIGGPTVDELRADYAERAATRSA